MCVQLFHLGVQFKHETFLVLHRCALDEFVFNSLILLNTVGIYRKGSTLAMVLEMASTKYALNTLPEAFPDREETYLTPGNSLCC